MAKNNEIQDRIDEIEAEFEVEIEIAGGGRGWTASVDGSASAKGESKMAALALLENSLIDLRDEGDTKDPDFDLESECSAECQTSTSDYCECKCGGANHPGLKVVPVGDKPCKCGCGQTTKRLFVPGHDARYHALEALKVWAAANGIADLDEAKKAKAAGQRKAARERRAEKRAAQAVVAEKIIARVAGSKDLAGDLPF